MNISKTMSISLCLLILLSGMGEAKQITIRKVVANTDIKTGDTVDISLEFNNPFNKSIQVKIQDNNVIGNNGLEIQCYEYTLPRDPVTRVSYDFPLQAFSQGEFNMDPATVTYSNPETGAQESVRSEPVNITIKQGQALGQQQGITQIYNCGGVSMRSTSISSSSSSSISISSGSQQTGHTNRQPANPPGDVQQGTQDIQNVRNEMERQQQDQKNMENELKRKIENNSDFRKLNEELRKQGYEAAGRSIKPESNDTGTFDYSFKKDKETANISGRMDAGNMENLNKQSSEDIKKLEQYIESNTTFRNMQDILIEKKYNLSGKKIDISPDASRFEYSYEDPQGKNASIMGNVTDAGEIKDIALNEPDKPFPYWVLALLIVPLLGIYIYRLAGNNKKPAGHDNITIPVDTRKEALLILERAVDMFNQGSQKEAYLHASNAVRFYFKGTAGIQELTSDEIISNIERTKDELYANDTREFFRFCDLVKFAKYEPNEEDFNLVVEYGKKIII